MGEKKGGFLKKISKRGKVFLMLAIALLVIDRFFYHTYVYIRRGFKRYAIAVFAVLCIFTQGSFSYPVRGTGESGGVSEHLMQITDSDIALVESPRIEYENLEILKEEDITEGAQACPIDTEQLDQYSLDEILIENTGVLPEKNGKEQRAVPQKVNFFQDSDWRLVLINKQHPIPDDYTFTLDTIKTANGGIQCDSRIMEDLFSMLQAASEDEINLAICSHYRDINRQEVLFNRKIRAYMKKGMSYMEAYKVSSQMVTVPGASEHQIGLAMDIVSDNYTLLEEGFAQTEAGIWLKEHCAEYGFILRYPQGKEAITGIDFEPWHFRYVGKEAAGVIMSEELCLEEFWAKYVIPGSIEARQKAMQE